VRSLVEKMCKGKVHNERLFKHDDVAKALSNACKRLELPAYSHRSLRRMFVVRAIERGVDVKAIAEWQGRQRSPPQTSARGMASSHESGGLIIWRVCTSRAQAKFTSQKVTRLFGGLRKQNDDE
jgi:hypothetical protein